MTTPRDLAERLCRPQRIGLFGHRGVGKTTLLTVLYREAVGGRLPGLRLAAADARTADYLSDKILQLESGQALPATLAETDLRFHLYHDGTRLDLLFKDYQGEHVEVGRAEPVRDFLRDCDAVWLCLDAGALADSAARLRREQEVEQLVEDTLTAEPSPAAHRPTALVLTKADLLDPRSADVEALAAKHLGMTRHALAHHASPSATFAVSSLRGEGLHAPLAWLAEALRIQDEERLESIFSAGADAAVLTRCVACFAARYPDAPATKRFRARLAGLRRARVRRRGLIGTGVAACLVLALAAYDVLGRQGAARFEADNDNDPSAALARWEQYQTWHPTRGLFLPGATRAEGERLRALAEAARQSQRDARLAELRREAGDPDADSEAVWSHFQAFRRDHPEANVDADLRQLRETLKGRRDAQLAARGRQVHDALVSAEQEKADLPDLLAKSDAFLREFAGTPHEADVRRRREAYLARLEERDVEAARNYSARNPLNFQTRREHYQHYLDRHPDGAFRREAEDALKAIENDWDKHDFRAVRDHFLAKPGDTAELVARCRGYLAAHPQGQFTAPANELLRWTEQVTAPRDYKVVLQSGQFEKKIARFFSRGPDLSVEVEVAGVRYGPSPVIANRYDPDWNYEFSRPVRWKLGDPVVIRVTDHDWKDRVVVEIASPDGDPLALRLLSGEASSGANRLTFASDFAPPALPKIE